MANTPQAKKRIRRNTRRAEINGNRLSRIRTFVKKVESAIAGEKAVDGKRPALAALFVSGDLVERRADFDLAPTIERDQVVITIGHHRHGLATQPTVDRNYSVEPAVLRSSPLQAVSYVLTPKFEDGLSQWPISYGYS